MPVCTQLWTSDILPFQIQLFLQGSVQKVLLQSAVSWHWLPAWSRLPLGFQGTFDDLKVERRIHNARRWQVPLPELLGTSLHLRMSKALCPLEFPDSRLSQAWLIPGRTSQGLDQVEVRCSLNWVSYFQGHSYDRYHGDYH